jgi:hypothetical protein
MPDRSLAEEYQACPVLARSPVMGSMGGLLEYAITPLSGEWFPTCDSLRDGRYGRRRNGLIARAVGPFLPYCPPSISIISVMLETPKTDAAN